MKKTYVSPAIKIKEIETEMPLATSLSEAKSDTSNPIDIITDQTSVEGGAKKHIINWDEEE